MWVATRSWSAWTCGGTERSVAIASHAALVADIVVRYGTPYMMAVRRIA